jgi:diadenosine tetraphosphate (Ap4A) HIT family hydrolase
VKKTIAASTNADAAGVQNSGMKNTVKISTTVVRGHGIGVGTSAAKRTAMARIYEDAFIFIETHESEIPWLKIFTREQHKEFSECTRDEKEAIWTALDIIERLMIAYYVPEKINIASFGNVLPHVHWHIMARFKEDSYFPEPMWGSVQRQGELELLPIEPFLEKVKNALHREGRA